MNRKGVLLFITNKRKSFIRRQKIYPCRGPTAPLRCAAACTSAQEQHQTAD